MAVAGPKHLDRCALVTRPRAEAAELAAALAARGITALIEPLIDIEYRSLAAPDLAGIQAVLFTSANGVRALARLTERRDVRVLAVGEATARRAQAEGFANVESAGGNAAALARLAASRLSPANGRLLHIAGSDVAGDLAGALRGAGFAVERLVLYEARAAASLSAEAVRALSRGTVDYALFFSPRTAAIFAQLVRRGELSDSLRPVVAVSISPAADAMLGALAFRERLVAARPDQHSLLAALDTMMTEPCA